MHEIEMVEVWGETTLLPSASLPSHLQKMQGMTEHVYE